MIFLNLYTYLIIVFAYIIYNININMDKLVDKYPEKKILYLNWYEAAIGHLLLFKC